MANQTNQTVAVEQAKQVALIASKAVQWLSADIENKAKGLKVPVDYNFQNEMTSAMLHIANNVKSREGVPALQCCTEESIVAALRDMAIQGLSMTRNQCYAIVYANRLTLQRSYFGDIVVLKYLEPNLKPSANVIYEGDTYEYVYDSDGDFAYLANISRKLENQDKPIKAAYGKIVDMTTGKIVYGCVMTLNEILTAWSHAKTDKVQKEFPQEMAKRTVLRRMIKMYINTTNNGNAYMVEAYNRTTAEEFEDAVVEAPTEKAKAIRSRSQGSEGLKALLETPSEQETPQDSEKTPVDASEVKNDETIPKTPENAPETQETAEEDDFQLEAEQDIPF